MERKLIVIAVSSALAVPMAAQAVEFSVSGHVNRAIISVDGGGPSGTPDAEDGDVQHVDGDSSGTRFRFLGSEELESGLTAGVHLELGNPDDWSTRQAHASLSGAFGSLTIGHGDPSSDGANYPDFDLAFLGGVTNSCVYHSTDGPACQDYTPDRQGLLRYDSPSIGPASFSVSTGENDFLDVAFSVGGSFGDGGYSLSIAHVAEYEEDVAEVAAMNQSIRGSDLAKVLEAEGNTVDQTGVDAHEEANGVTITRLTGTGDLATADFTDDLILNKYTPGTPAGTADVGDATMASATINFGQGTILGAGWAEEDIDDGSYQFVGVGHTYGDGTIGVYYKKGEVGDVDGSLWGVGLGHSLGRGAEAYAGFRVTSEDGMKDVNLLVAGMRVSFN